MGDIFIDCCRGPDGGFFPNEYSRHGGNSDPDGDFLAADNALRVALAIHSFVGGEEASANFSSGTDDGVADEAFTVEMNSFHNY